VREPWRIAAAHLLDAGLDPREFVGDAAPRLATIERMIRGGLHAPWTSSAGRLFDAVAAMVGLRTTASYEGQAAMELEWSATGEPACGSYPFEIDEAPDMGAGQEPERPFPAAHERCGKPLVVDTRPLVRAAADDVRSGVGAAAIARKFHTATAEMAAAICRRIREREQVATVALTGGVFGNAILCGEVTERLKSDGFRVVRHRKVPPGDGGLALGQLAVAARSATIGKSGATFAAGSLSSPHA
jgi:hydrogenase maturation protein HypF